MTEESVDLALQRGSDVDPAVGLERARQVDGAHLVDRQAFAQVLREVVRAPRGGSHCVEGGPPRDPMVVVVEVAVPEEHGRGIRAQHDLGPQLSDVAHDRAPQLGSSGSSPSG